LKERAKEGYLRGDGREELRKRDTLETLERIKQKGIQGDSIDGG